MEDVFYTSPMNNYKVVSCEKMLGVYGYEVRHYIYDGNSEKSETIFDGEHNLKKCFVFLMKNNIISKDEMKSEFVKWML